MQDVPVLREMAEVACFVGQRLVSCFGDNELIARALHLAGIDDVVPTRYQQINLSTFNSCSHATSMAVSLYLAVSLSTEELPQEIRMPGGNEDWDRAFPPWRHPLFGHFRNPQ